MKADRRPRGGELLEPGRNCWRIEPARRVAFLRNADAYYHELAKAIRAARRQIIVLAWDFDHRVLLTRNRPDDHLEPQSFKDLVCTRVSEVPELTVHVLVWDLSALYTKARDVPDLLDSIRIDHPRVTVKLDDAHPPLSTHHQKVVVIDDLVAFSGGMDITGARWDTAAHTPDDERRSDPGLETYRPYHDVQALVDGSAAGALGAWSRERWYRATGERIDAPRLEADAHDPWPIRLAPNLRDVDVAISRTMPAHDERPAVREIRQQFLDSIAIARSLIFIEQQYLTDADITEALSDRLEEGDGPEIVLIMPRDTSGLLARITMETLLPERLRRLRSSDRHGRLLVLYPDAPGIPDEKGRSINVHAKLMIIDDRLVRIGSANLNGKSMRSDSELDLTIVADGRHDVVHAIRSFRRTLLSEHLDLEPERIAQIEDAGGSLVSALESLIDKEGKTLRVLDPVLPGWIVRVLAWWPFPESGRADRGLPEASPNPTCAHEGKDGRASGDGENARFDPHAARSVLIGVAILVVLAVLWRWGPLAETLDPGVLADRVRRAPWTGPLLVAIYVVGCQVMVPVHLLHVVAGLVLGPRQGMLVAAIGTMLSAAVSYGIGAVTGQDVLRERLGARVAELSQRAGSAGLTGAILLRFIPGAPFGLANMVFGASHVGFPSFIGATAIVMLPSLALYALAGDRLVATLRNPSPVNIAVLAGVIVFGIIVAAIGRRLTKAWRKAQDRDA